VDLRRKNQHNLVVLYYVQIIDMNHTSVLGSLDDPKKISRGPVIEYSLDVATTYPL
jgi:hypothetical protein